MFGVPDDATTSRLLRNGRTQIPRRPPHGRALAPLGHPRSAVILEGAARRTSVFVFERQRRDLYKPGAKDGWPTSCDPYRIGCPISRRDVGLQDVRRRMAHLALFF